MEVELVLVTINNLEQLFAKVGLTPIAALETGGLGTLNKIRNRRTKRYTYN